MFVFPDTEKKLKRKISAYKSALTREKDTYGHIRDGSGKRYLLFYFYFVQNEQDKSQEYLDWYSREFPDDNGEPIQKLCWTLILHRLGTSNEARNMLAETMLSNLYLIPTVLGESVQKYDMWHSSNFTGIDYVEYLPDEVRRGIAEAEIQWMRDLYESFEFRRIRKRFIEIYCALKDERSFNARTKLVSESRSLLNILQ